MSGGTALLTLGGAVLLGFVVPWLVMKSLMPSLSENPRSTVTNYRGREVSFGLGIVWFVWAGCAIVGGVASSVLNRGSVLAVLTLAGPLALVAFAAGLIDDAGGSSDAKGFKGHLKAMAKGRLTTGGLKLLAIGAACLAAALVMGRVAPWGPASAPPITSGGVIRWIGGSLIAGAAVALTSNFLNLMDLRPGRALKVYSGLALFGVLSAAFLLPAAAGLVVDSSLTADSLNALALVIYLIGPVLAVWRLDLGETGMLGDAGANPMGAIVGLLIVIGLPLWGLIAYAVLMFALNLASERFSFSRIIETTSALRWLDSLGRQKEPETHPHDGGSPE